MDPSILLVGSQIVEQTHPVVQLVAQTKDEDKNQLTMGLSSAERLIITAAKSCYKSQRPGDNPNVTKVRDDPREYLANILKQGHGSVLEHASATFVFENVSRVFTHELVRHRVGCAYSQESGRYVRLRPYEARVVLPVGMEEATIHWTQRVLELYDSFAPWFAGRHGLDDANTPFAVKKEKTSLMRRLLPNGLATTITATFNMRALRHIIEMRTAPGAEWEMRNVFDRVAQIAMYEWSLLFQDFVQHPQPDGPAAWVPQWSKV